MALQFADTMNKYGTNIALLTNGLWTEVLGSCTLVSDPDPVSTRKVLQMQNTGAAYTGMWGVRFGLSSSQTSVGLAGRLWMNKIPTADNALVPSFEWRDASNNPICRIQVNAIGGIAAYNSSGTKVGEITTPVLNANAYNHVEAKAFQNSSTGTIEVRVNGASVLNLTGLALGSNAISQVVLGGHYVAAGDNTTGVYWKDLVIWDGTGSFNNNFMGTVLCFDTVTDSDVSFTWTASTGSNGWSILDNIPPLDDSAYISAASNLVSTFTLSDLPSNVSSVRGNVITTRARKIDSGDGNIQVGLISGASTSLGANRPITTAYTYWIDINETDPATGAQWTPVAFNSAQFQLARTV